MFRTKHRVVAMRNMQPQDPYNIVIVGGGAAAMLFLKNLHENLPHYDAKICVTIIEKDRRNFGGKAFTRTHSDFTTHFNPALGEEIQSELLRKGAYTKQGLFFRKAVGEELVSFAHKAATGHNLEIKLIEGEVVEVEQEDSKVKKVIYKIGDEYKTKEADYYIFALGDRADERQPITNKVHNYFYAYPYNEELESRIVSQIGESFAPYQKNILIVGNQATAQEVAQRLGGVGYNVKLFPNSSKLERLLEEDFVMQDGVCYCKDGTPEGYRVDAIIDARGVVKVRESNFFTGKPLPDPKVDDKLPYLTNSSFLGICVEGHYTLNLIDQDSKKIVNEILSPMPQKEEFMIGSRSPTSFLQMIKSLATKDGLSYQGI